MDFADNFFKSINKISKKDFDKEDVKTFFDSAKYLLENASKKSRIRDKFVSYYYAPSITMNCYLKSEKNESQYNLLFDIYRNEIVFYSEIRNWENIKNIDDSFWCELLDTTRKYNVKFNSHSGPFYDKENTPEFNANYKSIVFNIMRVYITAMLEPEDNRQNISFGQLELVWTANKCTTEILKELNIIFKVFYKLNYLLWKSEDIRKQNRINRRKRKK